MRVKVLGEELAQNVKDGVVDVRLLLSEKLNIDLNNVRVVEDITFDIQQSSDSDKTIETLQKNIIILIIR